MRPSGQLCLALSDERDEWAVSARGLTRIHIALSLRPEPQGREVDPDQLELFGRYDAEGRQLHGSSYAGAPLLLPF